MTWTRYMVDTNVLGRLTVAQRSSRFLRENCRVPEEVLFEASGFRESASLADLAYPFTVSVAEQLHRVMALIPPGDLALVDLYHDRGNADPLLIAMALDATARSEETLLHEQWMVVTEDAAVRAAAHQFGLETVTHNEFVALLQRTLIPGQLFRRETPESAVSSAPVVPGSHEDGDCAQA